MINYKKIGFIGLGKLGLPCAETMSKKGFDVLGYDIKSITSDLIKVVGSIDEVCVDRDIIFVAVPPESKKLSPVSWLYTFPL